MVTKDIDLLKIGVNKNGELIAKFIDESNVQTNVRLLADLHPDFHAALNAFRPILSEVLRIPSDIVNMFYNIRSVIKSGHGENIGIIINAEYVAETGQRSKVNTPKINIYTDKVGADVQLLFEKLQDEFCAFWFEGKTEVLTPFE